MTLSLWNLVAYSAQLAVLAVTAAAAAYLFRLDTPRVAVRYWQAVLATCFALPLLQTWTSAAGQDGPGLDSIHLERHGTRRRPTLRPFDRDGPGRRDSRRRHRPSTRAGSASACSAFATVTRRAQPAAVAGRASPRNCRTTLASRAEVLLSDDVEGPATVGVRRAVILLPRRIVDLPRAVQRAVLCHELLHVRRRDWLVTVGEELWCALFWFHPGVRLIASRACLARETLVDEAVIAPHARSPRLRGSPARLLAAPAAP